jgi:hypothetical protein
LLDNERMQCPVYQQCSRITSGLRHRDAVHAFASTAQFLIGPLHTDNLRTRIAGPLCLAHDKRGRTNTCAARCWQPDAATTRAATVGRPQPLARCTRASLMACCSHSCWQPCSRPTGTTKRARSSLQQTDPAHWQAHCSTDSSHCGSLTPGRAVRLFPCTQFNVDKTTSAILHKPVGATLSLGVTDVLWSTVCSVRLRSFPRPIPYHDRFSHPATHTSHHEIVQPL